MMPDANRVGLPGLLGVMPWGKTMAELHPEIAKETAQSALQFLATFANEDFGEFAKSGVHDRRHLAIALDRIEELSAMVLNLAERVTPNAEIT